VSAKGTAPFSDCRSPDSERAPSKKNALLRATPSFYVYLPRERFLDTNVLGKQRLVGVHDAVLFVSRKQMLLTVNSQALVI
jgi:hypothetical protein